MNQLATIEHGAVTMPHTIEAWRMLPSWEPGDHPRFRVSYRGESVYRWHDKEYRVRHGAFADDLALNPALADEVGTVTGEHDAAKSFPPAELMAYFPGYIGRRIVIEGWTDGWPILNIETERKTA